MDITVKDIEIGSPEADHIRGVVVISESVDPPWERSVRIVVSIPKNKLTTATLKDIENMMIDEAKKFLLETLKDPIFGNP